MDFIQVNSGDVPLASSIVDDLNGNKWVIIDTYVHLGERFVRAVRIPKVPPTYKIVERDVT